VGIHRGGYNLTENGRFDSTLSLSVRHFPLLPPLQGRISAMTLKREAYAHLLPPTWKHLVTSWLQEDIPSFDFAGYVVGDAPRTAILYAKSPGVLAGVPFFNEIFHQLNCTVTWLYPEGTPFTAPPRQVLAHVHGRAKDILQGERTALNLLARTCGIAYNASQIRDIALLHNFHGTIVGTRKTTPGFRLFEKYALHVSGLGTHRHDLSSLIMLKDNHITSCGSITAAVDVARSIGGFTMKVEVEVRNEEEAEEAVKAGADIVMLDNWGGRMVRERLTELRERWRRERKNEVLVEVSGGVTKDNVGEFMVEGVDVISMGALTQGVPVVDVSLKIESATEDCAVGGVDKNNKMSS